MSICPVCNGFHAIQRTCQKCSGMLEDQGKLSDYFDDYSPYMDIDLLKLEDGYPESYRSSQCVHLYVCPQCGNEQVHLIDE